MKFFPSRLFRSTTFMVALLLSLLTVNACVQDVGLIDRTQVNRLKKSDLYGVWYTMGIVSNMPSSGSFGFVGLQSYAGKDGKVLFDIEENLLIVYPYGEGVLGADSKWNKKKFRKYWDPAVRDRKDSKVVDSDFIELVVGAPVAMYPISSHFDVKRDYSAATGAQSNVLVENTSDRPWWQREYIRVDWMGNTMSNFLFPQGGVKMSPVDYFVPGEDLENPNHFYLAPEGGYFHFTRRMFGIPMSTGACSPYSLAPGDCSGASFDVRVSYRRVDIKRQHDYETRVYPMAGAQNKFGFFTSDRYTFDENYGLTISGHDYRAARWNIWMHSKDFKPVMDKDGKEIACATDYDCAEPAICDQSDWFVAGKCSVGQRIDYTKREIRPIVYHIGSDTPVDHLPAEYQTADGWADVFKETISWLRFWEEKWGADLGADKPHGFTDPQSSFGQRYCNSHADCSQHAVAQTTVSQVVKANRVLIAAKNADKIELINFIDNPDDRKDATGAYVSFVNASPGSAPATLTFGSASVAGVKYAAGDVSASKQGAAMSASDAGSAAGKTIEITVEAGAAKATLPNVKIKSGEAYVVVFYGNDGAAVLRTSLGKVGLRFFNAIATVAGDATKPSAGETLDGGVNGTKTRDDLVYGQGSDFAYAVAESIHAVFLRKGQRGDVSCFVDGGVGKCIGWQQELTAQDNTRRLEIRGGLESPFVICENQFTRTAQSCKDSGQYGKADAWNDCRYYGHTRKNEKGETYEFNPCADVNDGGLVKHAAEVKIGGDSRYNYMYWVTNSEANSPLGYGPAAPDPVTGEIQWATANVYGAAMITYAQYAKDLVDLLNGDLNADDVKTGKFLRDYVAKKQSTTAKDKSWFQGAAVIDDALLSPEQKLEQAKSEATVRMSEKYSGATGPSPTADDLAKAPDFSKPGMIAQYLNKNGMIFDVNEVFARLDKIKGTPLERAMINDEMALVASEGAAQPGSDISPEMLGKIAPTGWATPKRMMSEHNRMLLLGVNNIELAEFADPSLLGLAESLKCKAGDTPVLDVKDADWEALAKDHKCFKGDALRTALSVRLFRATVEHEVGHTVGLRHNFEGSADLVNYFDEYFHPVTGREKEPVLCADVTTPLGKIAKDDICDKDSFGETCKLLAGCTKSSQCPAGLACNSGQCIDGDGTPVGTCQGETRHRIPCDKDAACGGAGVQCNGGYCADNLTCTANSGCGDGDKCTGGFCVDSHSGKPRPAIDKVMGTPFAYVSQAGEMKKYQSRAGLTPGEVANRRTEYQYSTVMDYGQKVHSDIHGLGKYDYAAIKFGYGGLVEVFGDVTQLQDQVKRYAKKTAQTMEQVSYRLEPSFQIGSLISNPFNFMSEYMPPEANRNRRAVPQFFVDFENQNASKYSRNEADRTFWEVPYSYCSDEYAGQGVCNRFDTGVNFEEIVQHAGEAVEEYYLFDAFKRERQWFARGGSPLSYVARIQDRWLNPLSMAARYYALYNNAYRFYSWYNALEYQETGVMPSMRRASVAAFRKLASMIAAPAPGSYQYVKEKNAYVSTSYDDDAPGSQLNVPMGVGKFPWTTFATDKGYYYYDHPLWIGGYWDKIAAIITMTNSTANFLTDSVGEQLPLFRGTAIGFNTVYSNELARVLGGLAAGDTDAIGGSAIADPTDKNKLIYAPQNPFRPINPADKHVEPSVMTHSLRLFAAWQAIANLPAGFDPSFTDSMAVWFKGNGLQFTIGEPTINGKPTKVEFVEFEDPFGKKTYVAPKPNYSANRYSPTFRMLQRLNLLKSGCEDGSTCTAAQCSSGKACADMYLTKANGAQKVALQAAMQKEIEIVDYFRQLYATYGNIGVGL